MGSTISPAALVAQLDRASDYGSEGWGFESLRARHIRAVQKAEAVLRVGFGAAGSERVSELQGAMSAGDLTAPVREANPVSVEHSGSTAAPAFTG